jgi:ATP-dependent DNA helicase RecG
METVVTHSVTRSWMFFAEKFAIRQKLLYICGQKCDKLMENQNIEYKESWRDEYLKWICGFANAMGGTLYVGVRDNGTVCGIEDSKKLMEDIPNKVRDLLGILVDVNLLHQDDKEYLEICTSAYPSPISYHGHYYQRSGATNQELKGAALDRFMLRKQGRTWDGVPVPYVTVDDLDSATLDLFRRKATVSRRMDTLDLQDSNRELLDKLRLIEGDYLKRAAALLFHPDPERFVTGAYVKLGFFREGANLIFQDEIHGNLFHQAKNTLDLLTTKYLRALISYEGTQRVETLPVPFEALREALMNSLVHKAYESHTPVQIAVFDDRIEFCNCGYLPENWSVEDLLKPHRSRPYNPEIANTFFRAGEIESWGRGVERILLACKQADCDVPEFRCYAGEVWTVFRFGESYMDAITKANQSEPKNEPKNEPKTNQKKGGELLDGRILNLLSTEKDLTSSKIVALLGISKSKVKRRLNMLREQGKIRYVGAARGGRWEKL